jgi:hypothetical protein
MAISARPASIAQRWLPILGWLPAYRRGRRRRRHEALQTGDAEAAYPGLPTSAPTGLTPLKGKSP